MAELEEQEVDFARYGGLLARRWWLPVAGLVLGCIVGALLAASGGHVWKASALLSLGQPYTPGGGSPVTSFATNPRAVNEIIRSESALRQAARAAGLHVSELRGKVSSGQVGNATGAGSTRAVPLIELTVQGARPAKVEKAAAELAQIVIRRTTEPYVGTKLKALQVSLDSIQAELNTVAPRITLLEKEVDDPQISSIDRLLIATQLDNAEQRRGQLLDQQTSKQQQLALAQNVESATIVQEPSAVRSTARSRRNSVLVGGLVGLILGALAALAWDSLAGRFRS
jgi:uncharacterized protein involved in exopolysaccharide biosynthesis